jgi:release factor glutamine methyltransferase
MSWGSAIKENSLNYIVCNPPYIKKHDPHLNDLKHEPISALISEKNGLNDIDLICRDAYLILKDGGKIIMEHGYDQADEVNNIFCNNSLKPENTIIDYQGHERISIASK